MAKKSELSRGLKNRSSQGTSLANIMRVIAKSKKGIGIDKSKFWRANNITGAMRVIRRMARGYSLVYASKPGYLMLSKKGGIRRFIPTSDLVYMSHTHGLVIDHNLIPHKEGTWRSYGWPTHFELTGKGKKVARQYMK